MAQVILVVDDAENLRQLVKMYLAQEGYRVVTATPEAETEEGGSSEATPAPNWGRHGRRGPGGERRGAGGGAGYHGRRARSGPGRST